MLADYKQSGRIEAGCDEAGRGCLAGPVYAAAVILSPNHGIEGLNDSKKLKPAERDILRIEIENKALAWAIGICSELEIDEINILNASFKAMHRAIAELQRKPDFLLIDGNRFPPYDNIDFETVVKGDSVFASIAAASILAKTHRDEFMLHLDARYPEYGFNRHKGYATPQHIKAIREFGYSSVHRKSFHLKQMQLNLF